MILVHEKNNVLFATLTPLLGVEKRSNNNKWTPHYQTEFDGESEKNNRLAPRGLLFWTEYDS